MHFGVIYRYGNNDNTNNGFFVLLLFSGVRFNLQKRNILMNLTLNETVFGTAYLLGKDEYVDGKHRIKNITLIDYMRELNFIDHPGPVENLAVVWYDKDGDIYITEIYDHDSGEIYWDTPSVWSDADDEITNALLMYGGLENTIGELY